MHFAHLRLAAEAMDGLSLDTVRWIPSGRPGHRGAPIAPAEDRIAMLRLALADEPRFVLDDADARGSTPVYTVNTLARLREEFGDAQSLVLIIGADQLLALDTWREWRRLFALAHIAVAHRPGYDLGPGRLRGDLAAEVANRLRAAPELTHQPTGNITTFPMTALDISASAIRECLATGRTPRYLLPDAVLDYIASRQLYSQRR